MQQRQVPELGSQYVGKWETTTAECYQFWLPLNFWSVALKHSQYISLHNYLPVILKKIGEKLNIRSTKWRGNILTKNLECMKMGEIPSWKE